MKDIIKKYYELNEETKELLYSLYLFHELEKQVNEEENLKFNNLTDEEQILEIALDCAILTNLDGQEIIRRLLTILNCRDITINDILELTSDELIDLIVNEEDEVSGECEYMNVIKSFNYQGLFCVFLKNDDKYILTYEKNDDVRVLIFNSIEELLSTIIDKDLILSKLGY